VSGDVDARNVSPGMRAKRYVHGRVVIRAELGDQGTVIEELSGTEPWRPRILPSAGRDGPARVALVQSRASLLAGDDVELSVRVGAGAALELVEIAATLAHHVRGGTGADVHIEAEVATAGRLLWTGEPVIVAAGARVRRTTSLDLDETARALLGERVVLGRARERPGALVARTRIICAGAPLLDETLDTEDAETLTSAVVSGGARMVAGLTLAGVRDPDPPAGAMQAHGPATLWRSVGPACAGGGWPEELETRWRVATLRAPAVLAAQA
jgi:urease accessory protein